MEEIIKIIEKIKGYILAIASGLYGLGLLCWMYYSWRYNLGHLDAFEAQYFITGIFPSLIILFLFWLWSGFSELSEKIVGWLQSHLFIAKAISLLTSLILLFFLSALFIHLPFLANLKNSFAQIPIWLQASIILVLMLILMLIYPVLTNEEYKNIQNISQSFFYLVGYIWHLVKKIYLKIFKFFFWAYLLLAVVILAIEYIENFYPNLPQELGGVKPKKVIMITNPTVFTLADQVAIFPDSSLMKSGQTDTLLIYFYNSDKVIFKTSKEVTDKGRKAQTFELGHSEVKSIKWMN